MKVRYTGESNPIYFESGKVYEVLSVECGWLRIADETGDDYLYPMDGVEWPDGQSLDGFELCKGQMNPVLPSLSDEQFDFIVAETGKNARTANDEELDEIYAALVKVIVDGTEEEEDDLSERTKMALSIIGVPTEYDDDAAV